MIQPRLLLMLLVCLPACGGDGPAAPEPAPAAPDPAAEGGGEAPQATTPSQAQEEKPSFSRAVDAGIQAAHHRDLAIPVLRRDAAPEQPPAPPEPAAAGEPESVVVEGPEAAARAAAETGPRPLDDQAPLPFAEDRPALRVDGAEISTAELNQLVAYYRSFRPGSDDVLLQDAVAALIPKAAVEGRYRDALEGMRGKILRAAAALAEGEDFAEVVATYSDDTEAPSSDGRYTFRRQVAVQPFDRLAFASPLNEITAPFLTQYGFHILQVVGYVRGDLPKDDLSEVRHVLVMYPFEGQDAREEIRRITAEARIEVLEPGLRNLVPPEYRDRIQD